MGFDFESDLLEHLRRYNVDFVENHKTPLSIFNEIHNFLRVIRAAFRLRDHGVCRNDDTSIAREFIFMVRGEDSNVIRIDVRPSKKFSAPLNNRHSAGTEDNDTLL